GHDGTDCGQLPQSNGPSLTRFRVCPPAVRKLLSYNTGALAYHLSRKHLRGGSLRAAGAFAEQGTYWNYDQGRIPIRIASADCGRTLFHSRLEMARRHNDFPGVIYFLFFP
ncbi:MAG: hypothetical protein WA224_06965, partial [Candidatus Acidiferrales bacterium]